MPPRKKKKNKQGKKKAVHSLLEQIYYDPGHPGSYGGVHKLWREAKKNEPKLKKDDVEEWLASQDTYTLHKPVRYK